MPLSLKYALLGFLYGENMTGYQLKQYFDHSIKYFWPVSLSQIYPTLTQMSKEGLLDVEIIRRDKSLNSKVYHITAKGKEAFSKWIAAPMDIPMFRNAFLIKIFMGHLTGKDVIISQLNQQIKSAEEHLLVYQGIRKHLEEEHLSKNFMVTEAEYWMATVDYCIKFENFTVSWCKDTIKSLKQEIH